jgi:hypothetical protein
MPRRREQDAPPLQPFVTPATLERARAQEKMRRRVYDRLFSACLSAERDPALSPTVLGACAQWHYARAHVWRLQSALVPEGLSALGRAHLDYRIAQAQAARHMADHWGWLKLDLLHPPTTPEESHWRNKQREVNQRAYDESFLHDKEVIRTLEEEFPEVTHLDSNEGDEE